MSSESENPEPPLLQHVLQLGVLSQHDVPQSLQQRFVSLLSKPCPYPSPHIANASTNDATIILSFIETRLLSRNFVFSAINPLSTRSTKRPRHQPRCGQVIFAFEKIAQWRLMLVHQTKFDERLTSFGHSVVRHLRTQPFLQAKSGNQKIPLGEGIDVHAVFYSNDKLKVTSCFM